jgi:bifunctional UDP-N-acetylglucosamine pyrophosphorylase/glucosamine-1-phosphate N-acetyltransferase
MKSDKSKVLQKVAGLEMVCHIAKNMRAANVGRIMLVVSAANRESIEAVVIPKNIETTLQTNIAGTASATKVGLDGLGTQRGHILVTCGDTPLVRRETYEKMISLLDNTDSSIVILGFHTDDVTNQYGRLILGDDGRLKKITEYREATDAQKNNSLCNAGVYAIKNSELLNQFIRSVKNNNSASEYYLTDIIEIAVAQNYECSFILVEEREALGVNTRKNLAAAENSFQSMKREEIMAGGVTLTDPSLVFFSHDTEIGADVIIEPNVMFMGGVKVHNNVHIKSFSYLEGCELENGATVGPFARIRPGSILGKNSRIGNFCEINRSVVGEGVKIGHLSYLGDADVGENTNIGAGTITCNYDGYSKSKTKIGKNSFIGSNTTMIAPLEIGENSLTAAGSVVTRSSGKNSLIIARAEQRVIDDGMTRYRTRHGKSTDTKSSN